MSKKLDEIKKNLDVSNDPEDGEPLVFHPWVLEALDEAYIAGRDETIDFLSEGIYMKAHYCLNNDKKDTLPWDIQESILAAKTAKELQL